jgi:hypothetical protein
VTSSDDYLTIITSSGIAVTSSHDYPLTLAVVGVEKYVTIGSKSGQTVHCKLSSSLAFGIDSRFFQGAMCAKVWHQNFVES